MKITTYNNTASSVNTTIVNNNHKKLNYCHIGPYSIKNSILSNCIFTLRLITNQCLHYSTLRGVVAQLQPGDYNLNINDYIISYIVGSLLGNSYIKKNKTDNSLIITFLKCSDNIEYLMWFHKLLANKGYVSGKKPKLKKIISKNNKVLYVYSVDSYNIPVTDSVNTIDPRVYNINLLYRLFYCDNKKKIPYNFSELLTPLSLTTWYLDNMPKMLKLELSRFELNNKDIEEILCVFKNKYNIDTTIKLVNKDIVAFYIDNKSNITFSNTVAPHILPSLEYKLKSQHNKLNLLIYSSEVKR